MPAVNVGLIRPLGLLELIRNPSCVLPSNSELLKYTLTPVRIRQGRAMASISESKKNLGVDPKGSPKQLKTYNHALLLFCTGINLMKYSDDREFVMAHLIEGPKERLQLKQTNVTYL